ncbi:hypothetical protein ABFA07_009725 [Porites harrisoni]
MYSRDRRFTVEIPARELKKIFSWVLKSPSEETGGDLFGVWSDGQDDLENKLCIYHVSGPGKLCRRTPFSFDQDVRHSKKIATYLSRQHGLDHVAVWHSHQSALDRPSAPDEEAIWSTMRSLAINRIALFIASSVGKRKEHDDSSSFVINTFLFETEAINVGQFYRERFAFYPSLARKFVSTVTKKKLHLKDLPKIWSLTRTSI